MAELTVNGFPVVGLLKHTPVYTQTTNQPLVPSVQGISGRTMEETKDPTPQGEILPGELPAGHPEDQMLHIDHHDINVQCREAVLLEALQDGHWERVTHIVQEGVSPQCRDTVLNAAVQRGQWRCVLILTQLGISPGQSELALREAVTQNQWENVPELVRSCNRPELTDLALREAVNRCQWTCVRHLVKLDLLTKEQRDFVCQEAVPWGHFDCAVELLRQGLSPLHTQWIVFEVFRWGKWRLIVEMLQQGRCLSQEGSKLVFSAAVAFRQWEAFKEVLQYQRPSDQTVREAMAAAVNTLDHDFLQTLIRRTRNGLRVFKQLCLKEHWSASTASLLCVNLCLHERDLAFRVAATQGLWTYALELYEDGSVSRNSRRFALRRATRQGDWDNVVQMASKDVTEQSERRRAFLDVVMQGEWSWALKLLDAGVNVKKRDVRFTVKTCFCLNLWQGVVEVCLRFDRNTIGKRLVRRVLQTAIRNREVDNFVKLWNALRVIYWSDVVQSLIQRAFESRRYKFVQKLCQCDELLCSFEIADVAIQEAANAKKWNFIRSIIDSGAGCISVDQFVQILQTIVNAPTSWKRAVPLLDQAYKDDELYASELLDEAPDSLDGSALADWCLKRSFTNLSLLIRLLSKDWCRVDTELEDHPEAIYTDLKEAAFNMAANNQQWDTAVKCLKHLDPDSVDLDSIWVSPHDVIAKCKETGLSKWVVHLAMCCDDWEAVEAEMETCSDQDLIDYTAREAADADEWNLVTVLLGKCSEKKDVLAGIFRSALQQGNIPCAKLLIERVDLMSIFWFESALFRAVRSSDNREEMVRLCISAGVSPHQRLLQDRSISPMRCALQNGQLPLVRLLNESGSCPNSELHRLRNDEGIRAQLQRQGRQDILQYLDNAAANPASLQRLCRLTVAHLVGLRPGRRERVLSLPVPELVRDYIMFSEYSDIPSDGS